MISFREVGIDDASLILTWRMSNRVTKFMNTDVIYDLEAQKRWLLSCYDKSHYYHWIILHDDKPVGLINLADFSENESTTSWGFYIGVDDLLGYGAFIPPYFYNFLFYKLLVNKIQVEVFFNNVTVIGLHQLHGYIFTPSSDRVITKNGKEVLLVSMCLDKANWNTKRFRKFETVFSSVKWNASPKSLL